MAAAKRVLDSTVLERLVRIGGQPFLVDMIELFLEHGPRRLAAARAAFGAGELGAVYMAAHSVKSTAGNLGARALQAAAERAEGRAAAGDDEAIPPLLDEMEHEYERVRSELETERDRRKGAGTWSPNRGA